MSADLRAFRYPLEALRRRQEWERDILERKLGQARAALVVCDAEAARLDATLTGAARACGAMTRFDPAAMHAALGYLLQLRAQAESQAQQRATLADACAAARAACIAQQQKCEATEHHRQDSLDDYQREQHRRGMAAADSDWIARSAWRQAGLPKETT